MLQLMGEWELVNVRTVEVSPCLSEWDVARCGKFYFFHPGQRMMLEGSRGIKGKKEQCSKARIGANSTWRSRNRASSVPSFSKIYIVGQADRVPRRDP